MKTMTKILLSAVLMLAVVFAWGQKSETGDGLMALIQDYNNKMAKAIVAGDDEALLSFYHEEVVSLPNYGKMLTGIDAMRKQQQKSAESGNKVVSVKFNTLMVNDYGNAVVEVGTYDIMVQAADATEPVPEHGKYLTVWVKSGEGYKIINEAWNTDIYPRKAMKKAADKGEAPKDKKLDKEDGTKAPKKKPVSAEGGR
jgi:ketosteroid isomerase-like protein